MTFPDLQALLAKYDYSVPRYTSFPTAVQFQPNASQSFYGQCLTDINPNMPISLYVHIPFCHSLCHYCGCNTKIVHSYRPIEQYIASLLREIRLVGQRINQKIPVSRLHFGGGSPNYPRTEDLAKIIAVCAEYFDLSSTQIDMECDPRLLYEEKIQDYAALGLSRMSLGIQDFNGAVQDAINRHQPFSLVQEQMEFFRAAGIEHINFDLITGLPEQTLVTVEETLEKVLTLKPSRIAVFPYAHVPWMKKHQKLLEKYHLPKSLERFRMNEMVNDVLQGNDYKLIGIDHYALETDSLYQAQMAGQMRRNFQGYTDDPSGVILGFGLSSISQFEDAYVQNTIDAPLYKNTVESGEFPVSRYLKLSAQDQRRRGLIEQLMCNFEIRFQDYQDIEMPFSELALLEQDGLIRVNHQALYITERGKPFARIVASCFDPYFNKDSGRHAKAV